MQLPIPEPRSRANSRTTSRSKSKDKNKSKSKDKKDNRRHSFESPKNGKKSDGGLSLLNYLLLKEKMDKIQSHQVKQTISKSNFRQLYVVGKGGFGRVWKVEQKTTKKIYAMKQMSKAVILAKNSQKSVMNQRQLISYLRHPFLVNIAYAFQDRQNLFFIMDYMPGGDLRFHLCQVDNMSQKVVKFIAACIIIGIEYLHNNGVIHRDIKPQNIVVDSKGYFRLTDLGVAMVVKPQNSQNTSGTPGYMAPQVIQSMNHSYPVDFFALGVIIYQCAIGRRPYRGRGRRQIRQAMLSRQVTLKLNQLPLNWSTGSVDFINRLIKRRPQQRLGTRGINQIKNHPWLSDINWNKLLQKQIVSPFYVDINGCNFDEPSITQNDQQMTKKISDNLILLRTPAVNNLFQGYEYQPANIY